MGKEKEKSRDNEHLLSFHEEGSGGRSVNTTRLRFPRAGRSDVNEDWRRLLAHCRGSPTRLSWVLGNERCRGDNSRGILRRKISRLWCVPSCMSARVCNDTRHCREERLHYKYYYLCDDVTLTVCSIDCCLDTLFLFLHYTYCTYVFDCSVMLIWRFFPRCTNILFCNFFFSF